ncbi:hypothetical protein VaNZ11_010809 [Volvox africanus]|uniref:C2 NT-type domain-containing protein n=1 Tax=Volvox africanus TaxID=51714 RepID=A0ABQ5SBX1_9CHLO|nr:hypothetical protein VaNZ11_010809 [Volvox africanus]
MSSNGKALQVCILRLRCKEPRRYYLALHTLSKGNKMATRTETSEPSRSPDFISSSFLLRLPHPLASLPPDAPLLRVDLFSVPGPVLTAAINSESESQTGELVGSGLVGSGGTVLSSDIVTRLLQGQEVTLMVQLPDPVGAAKGVTTAVGGMEGFVEAVGRSGLTDLAPHEVLLKLELLDTSKVGEAGGGAPKEPLEMLMQECLAKQAALATVARQLDATAAQVEELSWRLVDAEKRTRSVVEDNNRLQQLLQAEQQAWRIPQLRVLVNSAMLTREELIERCESVMVAYGRERARNGELVERLKVLHAEQVDALELKKRYQQLQEAHEDQARAYVDLEGHGSKMAQLQATVNTQEEIIRNLEALLTQTVVKVTSKAHDAAQDAIASADTDAETSDSTAVDVGDAVRADLTAKLTSAEQQVQQLQKELVALQATTQEREQRLQQMEAELEALRQHTVTEFPAEEAAGLPSNDGPRRSEQPNLASEDQETTKEDVRGEAGEEVLRKLQTEAAQLMEEKTAALLRAEYAEGAAEAAQNELMEVTRKYAREIAALKTRLAEKDAAMMGGFGGLDALSSRSEPPFPAFPSSPAISDTSGPATASVGSPSSTSHRRLQDPRRNAALPSFGNSTSTEGDRGPGRTAPPYGGYGRSALLAPGSGSGSEDGQVQQGDGMQESSGPATEAPNEGARPLVWMRSRRSRVTSKSSTKGGGAVTASAPVAED